MYLKDKRGLTLIEALMATAILATLLITVIGTFLISRYSAYQARHRFTAMSLARDYLEKEIALGYNFGQYDTNTFPSNAAVVTAVDGINYSATPTPYPPTITTRGTRQFKTIGFVVSWPERTPGMTIVTCSERVGTNIANHQ